MQHPLALIAFILGFLGVSMAVFQENALSVFSRPPAPPPPVVENTGPEKTFKQLAAQAAKQLIEEKILHKAPPPKPPPAPQRESFFGIKGVALHPYQIAYTLIGLLAMGLGIFAWAHRYQVRLSGAAVALGIMAVAWQWVLLGIVLAVVVLILANLHVS